MRSGVGILLNNITCSTDNQMVTLLDLHRWNARMSDKNENWLFTNHFTTFPSISLCHARLSRYCRPSSFWFRIKRLCTHWNSWCHWFKFWPTPCNIYPAIERIQKQRSRVYFHSQPLNLQSHPISTSFSLSSHPMNDKTSLKKVTFWQCWKI